MERQYSIREVANMYGVTTQAVYKWINEGKLQTTETPGGRKSIPESELKKVKK